MGLLYADDSLAHLNTTLIFMLRKYVCNTCHNTGNGIECKIRITKCLVTINALHDAWCGLFWYVWRSMLYHTLQRSLFPSRSIEGVARMAGAHALRKFQWFLCSRFPIVTRQVSLLFPLLLGNESPWQLSFYWLCLYIESVQRDRLSERSTPLIRRAWCLFLLDRVLLPR